MFWHDIPVRFRYREDLYHSFDDILAMLWLIQRDDEGAAKADFKNQLLLINCELRWKMDDLEIRGRFTEQDDLFASYAQALNQFPETKMTRQAFLCEWKSLLYQIIVSFQSGEVEIQDGTERRKWEMLQRVEREIPHFGKLYMRPE